MATTEQGVEDSSAIPNRSRRRTPQEIEGFQSVVLSPGGKVDVLNVSNSGILVQTETRAKPGSAVLVRIPMTGVNHEVKAKIVRSEVANVNGSGLSYEVAIAFDETQALIDWGDAFAVEDPPSGPDKPMDLLPPDEALIVLQGARTPNRW